MSARTGKYVLQKTAGESFRAYIPAALPPSPSIDLNGLYPKLEKATRALTELNTVTGDIPNTALFIYMYVRKEALLSSQIEGTQSSFSDLMLFEHHQKPNVSRADVEEVSNYVKAIQYGLKRLQADFPLSLRLLREIHGVLLSGTRGKNQSPGEFRRSQNWIGGTRPGNALFVPPPVEHLQDSLKNFENFLHNEDLPALITAGIAHVQFETIHPFLDGNGRLGRLLVTLYLCQRGFLDQPILYLSLYLKQNRQTYYDLLQEVRIHGTWEVWLEFFLDGISESANGAVKTARDIESLFAADLNKILTLGRARFSCEQVFEFSKMLPQVTVPLIASELKVSAPTARSAIEHLVELGVLHEVSGKRRDRIFVYTAYLSILEKGADPF